MEQATAARNFRATACRTTDRADLADRTNARRQSMNHWQLFTNSFGKMLHPTLWVYGLLIALAGSAPGVVLLFNNQLLLSLRTATLQTLLTSFASLLGVAAVLG